MLVHWKQYHERLIITLIQYWDKYFKCSNLQFFKHSYRKSPLILRKLPYTLLSNADSFLAVINFGFLQNALQKLFYFYAVQYTTWCLYWLFNVIKAIPVNLLAGRVQSGGSWLLSDGNFIYSLGNYSTEMLCNSPWSIAKLRIKSNFVPHSFQSSVLISVRKVGYMVNFRVRKLLCKKWFSFLTLPSSPSTS